MRLLPCLMCALLSIFCALPRLSPLFFTRARFLNLAEDSLEYFVVVAQQRSAESTAFRVPARHSFGTNLVFRNVRAQQAQVGHDMSARFCSQRLSTVTRLRLSKIANEHSERPLQSCAIRTRICDPFLNQC